MPEILEKDATYQTANVTLPTTTEVLVVASPVIPVPFATVRTYVHAWVALQPGTGTTFYNLRLKRGGDGTGTVIGEILGQNVLSAAGSTEHADIYALDTVAGADRVQYSLTVQQAGATGNGTVLTSCIEVEVLNG
jgi:hypothetical protein